MLLLQAHAGGGATGSHPRSDRLRGNIDGLAAYPTHTWSAA